jgi:hypothetical protein
MFLLVVNYLYLVHYVRLRRLWKTDFSLATLAKDPHLVFCFVMVANHVVQSENML